MTWSHLGAVVLVGLLLTSCSDESGDAGSASPIEEAVYTGFHPTAWMASSIAVGKVPVLCLLPAGEDAIFWRPDRQQLARYQNARLVVENGAELEKWMGTASLTRSRVCNSAAGFKDRFIQFESTTHSHGGSGVEHTHEGIDGHTWLDPDLALLQARAIADAMKSAWPQHAGAFDQGLRGLETRLRQLKTSFSSLTPKLAGYTVLASHPAYDYLARGMGWKIINLDLDPSAPLSDADHADMKSKLEGAGPRRLLLWESAPSAETRRQVLDRHGLKSVVLSPGENLDGGPSTYWAEMESNLERLRAAVQ